MYYKLSGIIEFYFITVKTRRRNDNNYKDQKKTTKTAKKFFGILVVLPLRLGASTVLKSNLYYPSCLYHPSS